MRRRALRGLGPLWMVLVFACARHPRPPAPPPTPVLPEPAAEILVPVPWDSFADLRDDSGLSGLGEACRGSRDYYRRLKPETEFRFGAETRTAAQMASSLEGLLAALGADGAGPETILTHLLNNFDLLRSTGRDGLGTVLFTGYYEPWLEARLKPEGPFRHPLYGRPADLLSIDLSQFPLAKSSSKISGRVDGARVVPYFTREEIVAGGALEGRGLELVWLDNPVALFFLQIQGSGRVTLGDGSAVRVQYEAGNGHPYKSLGRLMIDQGKLEPDHASMEDIRGYLRTHPEETNDLLDQNPSYTFFRLEKGEGPLGNIRVPLTAGRSIATDATVFPKGAPCLIATDKPLFGADGKLTQYQPFTRFAFNQDTGGAITGPGRVDLYFGGGPDAERSAGVMKREGALYFLLPKKGG